MDQVNSIIKSFFHLTRLDFFIKRLFDFIISFVLLFIFWPIIVLLICLAYFDTGASGIFRQTRIGRDGRPFHVLKVRTMYFNTGSTVTVLNDKRISKIGLILRKYKLDELPQLWNVLVGNMSFVGPRPDVPGFMDKLSGHSRALLSLRPGITGPASLKYRNEEQLLSYVSDAENYNKNVIQPDKVRINSIYLQNWSLASDLGYIFRTLFQR